MSDSPKQQQPVPALLSVSRSICALVVARNDMLALVLGGRERWHIADGYTFIPADLPAGDLTGEGVDALQRAVAAIAVRWLGCEATLLPSDALYGPSTRHAIDRLALATDANAPSPLPLLHLERLAPPDELQTEGSAQSQSASPSFERVVVRAYRAALTSEPCPGTATAGLLWLAPRALRLALLGMPLADLLGQPRIAWQPAPHVSLPDDAFIFVPADHGERHLLRIVAKYGPQKLGLTVTTRDETR